MPRKFLRRLLPDVNKIREQKVLRVFGSALYDPNLWHLNRRSVAGGISVGLFLAFMPIPFQSIPAVAAAIWLRVNLLLAVMMVWITNPVTLAPVFYFCYRLGALILHQPYRHIEFTLTWRWIETVFLQVWQPFLLGCFIVSAFAALLGYWVVHWLWRQHVQREWDRRRAERRARKLSRERNQ